MLRYNLPERGFSLVFAVGAGFATVAAVVAGEELTYEECLGPGFQGLWSVVAPMTVAAILAGLALGTAVLRVRARSQGALGRHDIGLAVGACILGGSAFGVALFVFVFFALGVCLH